MEQRAEHAESKDWMLLLRHPANLHQRRPGQNRDRCHQPLQHQQRQSRSQHGRDDRATQELEPRETRALQQLIKITPIVNEEICFDRDEEHGDSRHHDQICDEHRAVIGGKVAQITVQALGPGGAPHDPLVRPWRGSAHKPDHRQAGKGSRRLPRLPPGERAPRKLHQDARTTKNGNDRGSQREAAQQASRAEWTCQHRTDAGHHHAKCHDAKGKTEILQHRKKRDCDPEADQRAVAGDCHNAKFPRKPDQQAPEHHHRQRLQCHRGRQSLQVGASNGIDIATEDAVCGDARRHHGHWRREY